VAHTQGDRRVPSLGKVPSDRVEAVEAGPTAPGRRRSHLADPDRAPRLTQVGAESTACVGPLVFRPTQPGGRGVPERQPWWGTEPDVGRVAYGVPARVDRLRGLGNAVVPQVSEHVGRLILSAEERAA
jgi:hypothetical protein